MYHKNGDVTVVTRVSQCHHRDQGLVIPTYKYDGRIFGLWPASVETDEKSSFFKMT